YRVVEEWNAAADTFVRQVPATAYRILQEIEPDTGFETITVASDIWPNPLPATNMVPNSSFSQNVDGWSRRSASPGITSTGPTHEAVTVKTEPGALKTVISASSGDVGTSVVEHLT